MGKARVRAARPPRMVRFMVDTLVGPGRPGVIKTILPRARGWPGGGSVKLILS